ncbi:MAG: hypothetical protein Fur0034_11410 [Desulfuromonadia bacterium]
MGHDGDARDPRNLMLNEYDRGPFLEDQSQPFIKISNYGDPVTNFLPQG